MVDGVLGVAVGAGFGETFDTVFGQILDPGFRHAGAPVEVGLNVAVIFQGKNLKPL